MRKIYIFLILLVSISIHAQQDAQYTQYMYNMSVINPGYATDNVGTYNFGGIYRAQWVNAEGAPSTASLFAHTPINDKFETGLNIVNDQIGDGVVNETTISGDLAYRVKIGRASCRERV